MLSPNSKTKLFRENRQWHADVLVCLLRLWDCLLFVVGGVERKSKTKAALKHSTLKGAMTSSFRKALLKSTLRKDQ